MFKSLFVLIGILASNSALSAPLSVEELRKHKSPIIVGDTLIIQGKISSHIYDFLSWEARRLSSVKYVSLNSLGGEFEWGMKIAEKLSGLNIETRVERESYCASICISLFSAGKSRKIHSSVWLGVHGARLGASDAIRLQTACYQENTFHPELASCDEFLTEWYARVFEATDRLFSFGEAQGVSETLRLTYMSLPEQKDWYKSLNILKIEDWVVSAQEAIGHNLATDLLD